MGKIRIGKSLQKRSAGDVKSLLEKRYPKASKKDIDACITEYFGKDEGAEKLNADGNSGTGKSEPSTTKK